jgi:hypothetical protein
MVSGFGRWVCKDGADEDGDGKGDRGDVDGDGDEAHWDDPGVVAAYRGGVCKGLLREEQEEEGKVNALASGGLERVFGDRILWVSWPCGIVKKNSKRKILFERG